MRQRLLPYETAFQAYLRSLRLTIMPVDESRRAFDAESTLKSLDCIVHVPDGRTLLIDVKGRRLRANSQRLENWATLDDVTSLKRWQELFGGQSVALLAYVYALPTIQEDERFIDQWVHGDQRYGLLVMAIADYASLMKTRSELWRTVHIPQADFRAKARPLSEFLWGKPAP